MVDCAALQHHAYSAEQRLSVEVSARTVSCSAYGVSHTAAWPALTHIGSLLPLCFRCWSVVAWSDVSCIRASQRPLTHTTTHTQSIVVSQSVATRLRCCCAHTFRDVQYDTVSRRANCRSLPTSDLLRPAYSFVVPLFTHTFPVAAVLLCCATLLMGVRQPRLFVRAAHVRHQDGSCAIVCDVHEYCQR